MSSYQYEEQSGFGTCTTTNGYVNGLTSLYLPTHFYECINGIAAGKVKTICHLEDDGYAGALIERDFFVKLDNNIFSIKVGHKKSIKDAMLNDIEMIVKLVDGHTIQVDGIGLPHTTLYWYTKISLDLRMLDPSVP